MPKYNVVSYLAINDIKLALKLLEPNFVSPVDGDTIIVVNSPGAMAAVGWKVDPKILEGDL